jgi:hypothetical protein
LAAKYANDGFENVMVLAGGVDAWRAQFEQQAHGSE